jgi:hypothetical protein
VDADGGGDVACDLVGGRASSFGGDRGHRGEAGRIGECFPGDSLCGGSRGGVALEASGGGREMGWHTQGEGVW